MPILLQLRDAHKAYADKVLLDGADLALTDRMKVGLIGRNGCGKSTLCRVLTGEEELDSGELQYAGDLRLGYLRQHDPFLPGETVAAFLQRDSGRPDWRCGQVAGRFELKGARFDGPVDTLSGGWKTRVKLAALLLHEPQLLLLDEPTNFLDLRTQLLLGRFLADWQGACLIVSHDRGFLQATCDHTCELARGRLDCQPGTVDAYLARRAEQRAHTERANAAVLAKRRQLERFVIANRANANTASQARSKSKQLERLQVEELVGAEARPCIRVPAVEPRRGPALRCDDLGIGYPGVTVAAGIAVEVEHGERVAVVGDNGEGKTTFLRTVAGSLDPRAGAVRWGYGCELGLYAQHVYAALDGEGTVRDHLLAAAADGITEQEVLDVAGSFLFGGDDAHKSLRVLSGGERARVVLAALLLGRHNVLILDEPSNHLDVETVDALAEALRGYAGTLLFTSHDRDFVAAVATGVIEVGSGRVASYPGDYGTYQYRVQREIEDGERDRVATPAGTPAPASAKRGRERYQLGKRSEAAERKVARLEDACARLEAAMLAPDTDPDTLISLQGELDQTRRNLDQAEHEWFAIQHRLETIDQA